MAVCMSLSIVPVVNVLAAVPGLVLWILHWVQVSNAKRLVIPPLSGSSALQAG